MAKKKKPLALPPGDVVTAWAEKPNGPGWANRIVWVLTRQSGGVLIQHAIQHAIQPEQQTDALRILFDRSHQMSSDMAAWVKAATVNT